MWFETRIRIIDILKTLGNQPVTGTLCMVSDSIPGTRADWHGYLINVRPQRGVLQAITVPESRTHDLNFIVECLSPQVLTDLTIVQEYRLDAYADVITALLEQYPRLESIPTDASAGRVPLSGVKKTIVGDVTFQSPKAYPDGQSQQMHYSFTLPMQVSYTRSTGC
jgi:hypothetical protein